MPWFYWHENWWGGWLMTAGMVIFWIAVIVFVIWLVRSLARPGRVSPPPPSAGEGGPAVLGPAHEDALAILKRRYAAGEIDRDEYLQKLRDLGESPPGG